MHVAHILASLREDYGGPPQAAVGLGSALSRRGIDISYWAPVLRNRDDLVETGNQTHLFPLARPHSWFRSPLLAQSLRRSLERIDLFHLHEIWSYPQYAVARLAWETGRPYVIRPAGELEPWRIRKKGWLKYLKKKTYLALIGRRIMARAGCLQAITPREIPGFRASGFRGPITVIPNGINPEPFRHLPAPEKFEEFWPALKGKRIVLFLSRLNSEKGLDQLIPAWARLRQRGGYNDVFLVVAGPDDRGYGPQIRVLAERIGVGTSVLFPGMVQGLKKIALISRAECYILPSYSEGFSMSILENLAAGKPVLITPGCNFPEVAEVGAGFICNPVAEAIESDLRKLLDLSPEQRRVMGEMGRSLVENNYSWDIAARKMITVYRAILKRETVPLYPDPAPVSSIDRHNR